MNGTHNKNVTYAVAKMPLQTLNEVLIPTWDDAQKTQI